MSCLTSPSLFPFKNCTLLLIATCLILVRHGFADQRFQNPRLRSIFSQPQTPYVPSAPLTPTTESTENDVLESIVESAEQLMSHNQDSISSLRKFRLAGLLGHSGALSTIAVHLLAGDSQTSRNIPSAVRHLRLAANAGQPDAHALLGTLHASGLADRHGLAKSHAKSIVNWLFAAESGNVFASTALGFRHLYGIDVKKSCHLAAHYYRRAARSIATDSRKWPSAANFVNSKPPLPSGLVETPPTRLNENTLAGESTDAADQDVIHYYRHSADRGNAMDRTTLGALYYFGGHGIEPNYEEAYQHLQMAANANNGQAHTMLGHIDMRSGRNDSAYMHFMHGVALNDHLSHYALGMIFYHGLLGKEVNYPKAKMHFELTLDAERKHAGAFFQLGMLYWYGKGIEADKAEAFKFFRKAAHEGHIQSKWNVGAMLTDQEKNEFQQDSDKDCQTGVQLLKEVAEDGEWRTVLEMAMDHVDSGDWYGALHRYLEAAHAGIELAQYNAGFLLEHLKISDFSNELEHWGRNRMLDEAYELYEYSALQGHTDSLIRSANVIYLEMKDYSRAATIFAKAADLHNAEGMVSLALMYAQGLGVPQSRMSAVNYLMKASDADSDAVAPAKVALLGLHLYWILEDMWNKFSGRRSNLLHSEENKPKQSTREVLVEHAFPNVSGDVAVVGVLLVALVAVLIVRTKRLARQTESEPGNRR